MKDCPPVFISSGDPAGSEAEPRFKSDIEPSVVRVPRGEVREDPASRALERRGALDHKAVPGSALCPGFKRGAGVPGKRRRGRVTASCEFMLPARREVRGEPQPGFGPGEA